MATHGPAAPSVKVGGNAGPVGTYIVIFLAGAGIWWFSNHHPDIFWGAAALFMPTCIILGCFCVLMATLTKKTHALRFVFAGIALFIIGGLSLVMQHGAEVFEAQLQKPHHNH